jgi:hypothetical protein
MGIQDLRIDLSRWLVAYIVVRMRELYGLDEDTPLDDALHHGSVSEVTYEEYCELHGILRFLSTVQTIAVERDSMAHFFQCAAHGLNLACMRVECAVQCDPDPSKQSCDAADVYSDEHNTGCFSSQYEAPMTECDVR